MEKMIQISEAEYKRLKGLQMTSEQKQNARIEKKKEKSKEQIAFAKKLKVTFKTNEIKQCENAITTISSNIAALEKAKRDNEFDNICGLVWNYLKPIADEYVVTRGQTIHVKGEVTFIAFFEYFETSGWKQNSSFYLFPVSLIEKAINSKLFLLRQSLCEKNAKLAALNLELAQLQ